MTRCVEPASQDSNLNLASCQQVAPVGCGLLRRSTSGGTHWISTLQATLERTCETPVPLLRATFQEPLGTSVPGRPRSSAKKRGTRNGRESCARTPRPTTP
uniref:Uncharacterized protein n=1 Tax=Trichuris muris TaxID=70415 RepID=A0A5S6PZS6_TRIMR